MDSYTAPGILQPTLIDKEDIISIVCRVLKTDLKILVKTTNKRGSEQASNNRLIITYFLVVYTDLDYNRIGTLLNASYSTVISRGKRIAEILQSQDPFYDTIKKQVKLINLELSNHAKGIKNFMTD